MNFASIDLLTIDECTVATGQIIDLYAAFMPPNQGMATAQAKAICAVRSQINFRYIIGYIIGTPYNQIAANRQNHLLTGFHYIQPQYHTFIKQHLLGAYLCRLTVKAFFFRL